MSWLSELLVPWWAKAALLTVVVAMVFSSGVYVEGLRWSKADGKAQLAQKQAAITALKSNIRMIAAVSKVDSEQALRDADTLEELERVKNEVLAKVPDSPCFSTDTVDELRRVFD